MQLIPRLARWLAARLPGWLADQGARTEWVGVAACALSCSLVGAWRVRGCGARAR